MGHSGFAQIGPFNLDLDKTHEFYAGNMTDTTQRMLAAARKLAPDII